MGEDKVVELNRLTGLVKSAVEFRQSQRDSEYVTNEAHYEGLHWNLANSEADSPFIVKSDINHLKNAVDIRLGSIFAETYYGDLKPLSEQDVDTIEQLNVLYKNEWFRLKMDKLIEKAIKAGAIFDNGYIEFGYDTNAVVGGTGAKREGSITANFVDTANIYLDPSAGSLEDCQYYVKKIKTTKKELQREHPDWYQKLKDENLLDAIEKSNDSGNIFGFGRDYNSGKAKDVVIDAIYEKYKTKVQVPIEISEEELAMGAEQQYEEIEAVRIKISHICGKVILDVNTDYPFEEFNIVPFQWESAPQTPYGVPLLRGLTIPQKVANLIESSINNIAVHYTIPTWIISDDSGLDVDEVAELINALGVVWKVTDINTAIKQLEPPKINSDIIAMGQTFVAYIKEYCGVTGAYYGNIGTAGSTAEGTNQAINRATVIDNNPLGQIEDFVERLTRLLIKFMTRYYAGDTMYIRQDVDHNKYEFQQFVLDYKFNDINYDFDVDLGSRSKTDKNRQYNLMKDIYQLQNQYHDSMPILNVADVVRAAQLDNASEMSKRIKDKSDEAMQQKTELIMQLVQIANTATPNGTPLIDEARLSDGIMDVINDDNDLSTAQGIVNEYQEYQEKLTELKQTLSEGFTQQQQVM